jgi:hypothetical protein
MAGWAAARSRNHGARKRGHRPFGIGIFPQSGRWLFGSRTTRPTARASTVGMVSFSKRLAA